MAVSKAKRSVHLAQPLRPRLNGKPAELKPVRAHVYHTIADMNGGFETVIQGLKILQNITFLSDSLKGVQNLICRIRAQANHDLMKVLDEREEANADHFHRLNLE